MVCRLVVAVQTKSDAKARMEADAEAKMLQRHDQLGKWRSGETTRTWRWPLLGLF